MAKIALTKEEREKIARAVKKAESRTSGEIATAFIKESCDYAIYELMFAIIIGFFWFVVMMFFTDNIENFLQGMLWHYETGYLVAFYGFSIFLVISACYFFANISAIDRLIIPKKIMKQKVNERAIRHFMESGVCYTKNRTGILIFISILEHRVELLADKGINDKIDQSRWEDIVFLVISGIRENKTAECLGEAILQCGELLAEFFPIKKDDENELANEIKVLER